jgi:hypothetical protein
MITSLIAPVNGENVFEARPTDMRVAAIVIPDGVIVPPAIPSINADKVGPVLS